MATTSRFHQVLHLIPEVGGRQSLTFFPSTSSNTAAKNGYKKGNSLPKALGKNLPQQFLESDEKSANNTLSRINHKFGLLKSNNKKAVSTPLKKYTSSKQNNQLYIKLIKTDQQQIVKGLKIQFLEWSSQKQPPA